jgi:hypothetical protein
MAIKKIEDISFDQDSMFLNVNGTSFEILLEKVSPKLQSANQIQRSFYKISPSGYGIHWPLIDEDLSLDLLLKSAQL